MKTREFIKKTKEMGFVTRKQGGGLVVQTKDKFNTIAYVSRTVRHIVNISFYETLSLEAKKREELFLIIVGYANTPIEERKDEERFVIKSKFSRHYAGACIDNYLWEADGGIYLSENPWGFKTSFTKKEIEVIKEKYQVSLDDFELIEEEKWGND